MAQWESGPNEIQIVAKPVSIDDQHLVPNSLPISWFESYVSLHKFWEFT